MNRVVWSLAQFWTAVIVNAHVLGGDLEAQRPTPSDTVPRFAFAIDPAAIAAGLRPLRTTRLAQGEREVRVWSGFGLGIPYDLYRIHALGDDVRGALILWWGHDGEWGSNDNPESMHAYVARVFSCGRIRRHDRADACEANLSRRPPDWKHVLAQIDSAGVRSLRAPPEWFNGTDGFHMVVETRDAAGYRTAYFAFPSDTGPGDTPRANAILKLLDRIRASVYDTTIRKSR